MKTNVSAVSVRANAAAPRKAVAKVTLLKPHTHDSKDYQPGDSIDVDVRTAQWLADQGVIEQFAQLAQPKPKQE